MNEIPIPIPITYSLNTHYAVFNNIVIEYDFGLQEWKKSLIFKSTLSAFEPNSKENTEKIIWIYGLPNYNLLSEILKENQPIEPEDITDDFI